MNDRPGERIGKKFLSFSGHRVLRVTAFLILTLTLAVNTAPAQAQEPGVLLTGHVANASGKAIPGAQVRLDGPTVHARAVTDGGGDFIFLVPPVPLAALLRVTRSGFETLRKTVTLNGRENISLGTLTLQVQELRIIGSTIAHERLPFNSTPASTKVFPREAYRDEGQPGIEAVLDQTAGLQTVKTSVFRATPEYPVVRNGSPAMTAASVDGIRVESPRNGLFNVSLLPTYVLQDVEVSRGAGSTTIAPHQLFGSVNFRTADPAPVTRATFETEGDSAHGSFGDVGGTIGSEDSPLSAAMMFSVDGSSNADVNFRLPPSFASAYSRRAGFVKTRYSPNGDASITATVLKTHLNEPGFDAPVDDFTLVSLDLSGRLNKRDDMELRAYGYGLHRRQVFFSTNDGMEGASATWSHAAGANRYEASAEIRHAVTTGGGFLPGSDQRELSLRTSAELHPNERATITLGNALVGFHQDAVIFPGASLYKGTNDVVHAGAAYRIKPGLSVRASVGTGVDPSDLQTLAALRNIFALPTSIAYDAGAEWRLHGDTTTLSADAYHTIVHAPFLSASVDGAEVTIQQFKRVGLGYIAQFSLTGQSPFGYRIPYSRSYGEISYKWPRGSRLSLGALTYGHGNATAGGNAFTVFNSNLELSLGRFNKLQVSVENLTDARGALAFIAAPGGVGYAAPRTFRFMFRQSFGGGLVER